MKRLLKVRIFTPIKGAAYGIRPGPGGRWEQALRQEKGYEPEGSYEGAKAVEGEEQPTSGEAQPSDGGRPRERSDSEYIQRLFAAKERARKKKGLDAGGKKT